jgi:hypothetical protein
MRATLILACLVGQPEPPQLSPELQAVQNQLKSAKASERMKGLTEAFKQGPDALPIAGDVVRLWISDPSTSVVKAAEDALGKISPEVFEQAFYVLADGNIIASQKLGRMGEKA